MARIRGDRLDGDRGDDLLGGGGGRDVFEFDRGDGDDLVGDFAPGIDRLDVPDFEFAGPDGVFARAGQEGSDVVIALNSVISVTLRDIELGDLSGGDFIL